MKKRLLPLLLLTSLLFTACGGETPEPAETDINSDVEQEQTTDDEASNNADSEADATEAVTITTEHFSGERELDGPSIKYTYEYDQPTVSISGNDAAAKTIQDELDAYINETVDEFTYAYEDLDDSISEYSKYITVNVMRADAEIISIQMTCEGFEGGAHGYKNIAYFNYYTSSGEHVTFDSLGSDFRQKAQELVLSKAEEMQEEEPIFFDGYETSVPFVVLDGTETSTDIYNEVYGEADWGEPELMTPTFYITDAGFGFTSGQYVLQPYAAGIIDFNLTAADFGEALEKDISFGKADETSSNDTSAITKEEYDGFEGKTKVAEFGSFDDFDKTLSYDFTGTWYDASLGEAFRITDEGAYVYIPYLELYGDEAYDWELVDRSADGLCPELDIYFGGRDVAPLAYYVAGARDTYFWCNGQSQVFCRQG